MSNSSWYDDFLALRAAVVRAVSMSWATDSSRKDLHGDLTTDAIAAMQKWFDYTCPFDMYGPYTQRGLAAADSSDRFLPAHTGGWVGVNNTIRLYLPPAPDEDQQAEALAAYNQKRPFFLSHPNRRSGPAKTTGSSLNVRTGPGLSYPSVRIINNTGTPIWVQTQAFGDSVNGNYLWDQISDGYVSDAYVSFDD